MTAATSAGPASLMTTEQLLAMPDDGMDRELVRGEVRQNRFLELKSKGKFDALSDLRRDDGSTP